MPLAGEAVPERREVLVKLAELETSTATGLAGALNAWKNQRLVAEMLVELESRGYARPGRFGGWRVTERGLAAARRTLALRSAFDKQPA
jgi:hypothetical protein